MFKNVYTLIRYFGLESDYYSHMGFSRAHFLPLKTQLIFLYNRDRNNHLKSHDILLIFGADPNSEYILYVLDKPVPLALYNHTSYPAFDNE